MIDNFTAENKQELTVSEHQLLIVNGIEDEWCICETMDKSETGLVPLSYLTFITENEVTFTGTNYNNIIYIILFNS